MSTEVTLASLVTVPVIIAVVALVKVTGADYIPSRFYPLIAVAVGLIASSVIAIFGDAAATEGIINGLLTGLAAAGLYDHKNLVVPVEAQ